LIAHDNGYVELYDHTSAAAESRNIAEENPALVEALQTRLQARLKRK
jgi:iduronate 2-sulfatase